MLYIVYRSTNLKSFLLRALFSSILGGAVFVKAGKGRSYLCISCRSGWVALTGIYYGGRKKMEARDFANGFIHPGAEHLFIKDS